MITNAFCVIYGWALYKNCCCQLCFLATLQFTVFATSNVKNIGIAWKNRVHFDFNLRFEMWIHNYLSPIVVKIPLHAAHVEIPFDNEYVGSNLVFRFYAHICHRFSVNPGPSNPVWEQSQLCHYLSDFLGTTHVVFTRFVTDSLCSHFSIFFSCLSWDGSPLLLSARSHFSTRLIIIEGWTPNRLVPQIRDFWN